MISAFLLMAYAVTTDLTLIAENYANALLNDAGITVRAQIDTAIHPAMRNAQCGLMVLTGRADGAAQQCPVPLASCADGVIAALKLFSDNPHLKNLDGGALLSERAALAGYTRAGSISSGGSCRLLPTVDRWIAVNLARDSDWEMLPAWLEIEPQRDWNAVAVAVAKRFSDAVVEQGRLLGLAVSAMAEPVMPSSWYRAEQIASVARNAVKHAPLVIDLSSLWAGPLCTHLLQMLDARIIKVESMQRPDGARSGPADFYNLLNANKESVALDLNSSTGREQLRQLLLRADIVIEAARPRALRQMNIVAEEVIAANPALTWLSITGYGRTDPQDNWIAFGDDAGVAAGLSRILFDITGEPLFCGDAIADPLTGMHAAFIAWSSYMQGGGRLIALSLRDVVAHCIHFGEIHAANSLDERYRQWDSIIEQSSVAPVLPKPRRPTSIARPLGADTQAVLAEFGISC